MEIRCNAKINLTLDVGEKLPNGYHTLDSVMQAVSLSDRIIVEPAVGISVSCSDEKLSGKNNIAYIAALEFFNYAKISGGADIYIEKNIPYPSGLGGGSADAAGIIKALNKIYDTGFDLKTLAEIGLKVGSDVPFCIFGGTKRVMGRGETVIAAPPLKNVAFVIAKDGFKESTGCMYNKLDSSLAVKNKSTDKMIAALKSENIRLVAEALSNDFELCMPTGSIKNILNEVGALGSCLSGSGPCVFGIFENFAAAKKAEEAILSHGIYAKAAVSEI